MNITQLFNNFWNTNEWLVHSAVKKSCDVFYAAASWCRPSSPSPQPVQTAYILQFKRMAFLFIGVGAGYLIAYYFYRQKYTKSLVESFEPGVIYLFTHPRCLGVPSDDFAALRLETWLRMTNLDYQIVLLNNIPLAFPLMRQQTIPFLEFEGQRAATIDEFSKINLGVEFHLKPDLRAIERALDFLIEYSLYPCSSAKQNFILAAVYSLLTTIGWSERNIEPKNVDSNIARADLKALADYLGGKLYLTGLTTSKADASAFAALALIFCGKDSLPLSNFIDISCPNLREYFERIKGRVYLFQYPRMSKIPNLSPYCLKLENWLRMTDIKYTNVDNLSVLHRSSEGTLPYVELNGEPIVDSAFIIQKLPEKLEIQSPEDLLTTEQKSTSLAFERLVENSLFLGTAKYRYEHLEEIFTMWPKKFGIFQPLFNKFIKRMMISKLSEKLVVNGMGRHSSEDILGIVTRDLDAVSVQLGDKPFLMGDFPTKVDSSLFAAIALIVFMPFDTPAKIHIQKNCRNLEQFAIRIREKYWPDFEQ